MKVVLLNPPGDELYIRDHYCSLSSKANYYWQPADLTMLSGILSTEHTIEVIDAIVQKIGPDKLIARLRSDKPDVIVSLVGSASRIPDMAFLKRAKEATGARVIITGDFVLEGYESILKESLFIDAVLLDFTSRGILQYLSRGNDSRLASDSLAYRNISGEIIVGEREKKGTYDVPVPRHELFPLKRYRLPYLRKLPFVTTLTSFGCPFHCEFCQAATLGYKYRPASNVIEELKHIKAIGAEEVYFNDSTIEANKENLRQICEGIKRLGLLWSCNARVDTLTYEMLKLMKESGCYFISFGIESGNQKILDLYKKGITITQAEDTIRDCKALGIGTAAYFIIGLPGETTETIEDTIRLAKSLDTDYASFSVASPDFGTPLRDKLIKDRGPAAIGHFDRSKTVIMEDDKLSSRQIASLCKKAVLSFYLRWGFIRKQLKRLNSVQGLVLFIKDSSSIMRKILYVK
ncbi:MAG: radical SAM protein [Candidatus Omnitrophica bacterium]|nr:radical SAM protein [Candidatus Omnitrophota bacterium]